MPDSDRETDAATPRVFATTHWSVVLAAGEISSAPARRALETLCREYWYPIYVYVRRKGYGPDDAQDLTQEFFAQLIAKEHLRLADRHKGRFRSLPSTRGNPDAISKNNPTKAYLVRDPKEWPWSSARFRDPHGVLLL